MVVSGRDDTNAARIIACSEPWPKIMRVVRVVSCTSDSREAEIERERKREREKEREKRERERERARGTHGLPSV